jgi:hypothetical protein
MNRQTVSLTRLSATLVVIALMSSVAFGTWSIVVTDRSTGEVVVAGATCLNGFDLKRGSPVMLVGIGGAAAQSSLDSSGKNRRIIWDELLKGTPPELILEILRENDSQHESRQYGIVDMLGRSVSFSGRQDGAWAGHAFGQSGSLSYAIQGNVLTGSPVVEKCKEALLSTKGDLVTRVLAAMEAARQMGGDGRCSCSNRDPTQCGSPPPDFDKSAHVGYFVVSRIGDTDGVCNKDQGCVSGTYYLDLNLPLRREDPDPVFIMAKEIEKWRASLTGRPDHLLTRKSIEPSELPADGSSEATLLIEVHDILGDPIKHGGATVVVEHDASSAGSSTIGGVLDEGNGTYSCILTAGTITGTDVFRIAVDDGTSPVTLFPFPTLELVPPLWSRSRSVSVLDPQPVEFLLHGPEKRSYLLTVQWSFLNAAGSPSGPAFAGSLLFGSRSSGFLGTFDSEGKARATFAPTPEDIAPLVGKNIPFVFFTLSPVDFVSNVWPILVTP